jgi:hypothetical protein
MMMSANRPRCEVEHRCGINCVPIAADDDLVVDGLDLGFDIDDHAPGAGSYPGSPPARRPIANLLRSSCWQ